MIGYINSH